MPLMLPKAGRHEFEEKRSRFLSFCAPASTLSEAHAILEEIRSGHPKASHHVFAYKIGGVARASDDGEPSGTGGVPVLGVFEKAGIVEYVCVVTRYFGGILLGAGGLVRAYSKAAKCSMDDAGPVPQVIYKRLSITCDYPKLESAKYKLEKLGATVEGIQYTDKASISVKIEESLLCDIHGMFGYGYDVVACCD